MQIGMQIGSGNTLTSPASAAASPGRAATLDYDAFLKLLIAQMKNQDPTKPMDSSQFMSQLASFSNVEQGIKMNQKLDSLMTSMALTQVDSVVGRTIVSADESIIGTVAALRIVNGGAVAVLEDGREITLGPGVLIG